MYDEHIDKHVELNISSNSLLKFLFRRQFAIVYLCSCSFVRSPRVVLEFELEEKNIKLTPKNEFIFAYLEH